MALMLTVVFPRDIDHVTAIAIGTIVDVFAAHGIRVNLKIGKSEAIMIFAGRGSKAVEKTIWSVKLPVLRFTSQYPGQLVVPVSNHYKHLDRKGSTKLCSHSTSGGIATLKM